MSQFRRPFALLLDVDGVLFPTPAMHNLAWIAAVVAYLGDMACKLTPALIHEITAGYPAPQGARLLLEHIARLNNPVELANLKGEEYAKLTASIAPYEGVAEVLHRMKEHGFKLAVVTASRSGKRLCQTNFPAGLFDVMVDAEDVPAETRHDKLAIYHEGARRLGVDPTACCVVEDSSSAIERAVKPQPSVDATKESLIPFPTCIGISTTEAPAKLATAGARQVIAQTAELSVDIVEKLFA